MNKAMRLTLMLSTVALVVCGVGCTASNSYPTIAVGEQWIETSNNHFDKAMARISDEHKALAATPEIAALIDTIDARRQDESREFAMALKSISENAVDNANARAEQVFGPLEGLGGGVLGLGSIWALVTGRRKEREQGEDRSRREKIEDRVNGMVGEFGAGIAAAINGINELKQTLALNSPPPASVVTPPPTSVAPIAAPAVAST